MRLSTIPSFWFVGFSGHRRITEPEKVYALLVQELQKLRGQTSAHLAGMGSVAIGGDQLFLKACKEVGLPFQTWLPFPAEEFRKDFETADWSTAESLMASSIAQRTGELKGSRDEAYLACGLEIVNECDVLIVVWNGEKAAGKGGTGDIVEYARQLQRPLIWINPVTNAVTSENFTEQPFDDDTTNMLRKVLHTERDPQPPDEITPRAAIQRLMEKSDTYATKSAPRLRFLAASVVLMNLAIVGLAGAGAVVIFTHIPHAHGIQTIFNVIKFAMLVFVSVMAASNFSKHRQGRWLECRFAAELCRSLLASWDLPVSASQTLDSVPSEFSHLARSLCFLRSVERQPPLGKGDALIKQYIEDRIDGQIRYYQVKSQNLLPWKWFLHILFWLGMIASGILTIALLDPFLKLYTDHANVVMTQLRDFAPILATSALSLVYVYEIQRRLTHNKRMVKVLTHHRTQIATAPNPSTLESHIVRCEHDLLGEVQDWYYYSLYGKA